MLFKYHYNLCALNILFSYHYIAICEERRDEIQERILTRNTFYIPCAVICDSIM